MTNGAGFQPAGRSSDHATTAHRVREPVSSAHPAAPARLHPSRVPVSLRAGTPYPTGGRALRGWRIRAAGPPGRQARPSTVPARAIQEVLRAPGQPLADPVRQEMETRLSTDFSGVRIHTDAAARASAAGIGAQAYTAGNHVVIGDGGADTHVLAHELIHVIQQREGPVTGTDDGSGLRISDPSDLFEREAAASATRAMSAAASPGRRTAPPAARMPVGPTAVHPLLVVQRKLLDRGKKALESSKEKRQELLAQLYTGEEVVENYTPGVCYDAVAFCWALDGKFTLDRMLSDGGQALLADFNFDVGTRWTGESIPRGNAVGFKRTENDPGYFHAVIAVKNGTIVRGVNSDLTKDWSKPLDLMKLKPDAHGVCTIDGISVELWYVHEPPATKGVRQVDQRTVDLGPEPRTPWCSSCVVM
jgi:hypothetical protein